MPLKDVFHEEVVVWLGPEHLGARPYLEIPFRRSTTAWIGGGLLAVVALFVVLLWRKQRFSGATKELAILCVALIALAALFNFRSVRYMVPIVSSLCLLLAVVFHWFLEQRSPVRVAAAVSQPMILMAGLTHTEIQIYLRQRNARLQMNQGKIKLRSAEKNVAEEKRVAEELGTSQQEGKKMVLIKAVQGGGDLLYDSFYLFRAAAPAPPVIGVCVVRDFPVVREVYPNVEIRFTRAQFILWRVTAE
jgi:hypothetical protein